MESNVSVKCWKRRTEMERIPKGIYTQEFREQAEALIVTFWQSFEQHEASHRSSTFQPLFQKALEVCQNGNEEIAYTMLWSGMAYSREGAAAARAAKEKFAQAA